MLRSLCRRPYAIRGPSLLPRIPHVPIRPPPRAPILPAHYLAQQRRAFHSTRRNEAGPLVPILATLLKASTTIEFARTAGRIILTFTPLILMKNLKARKKLQRAAVAGIPTSEEKKQKILKKIRSRTMLFHAMLFSPIILLWATIVASLEQTPLTGRWRMIILSPEEEQEIAKQLAGPGWYRAVGDILSPNGEPVRLVPPTDWRYAWVAATLRHLESVVPKLCTEREDDSDWFAIDDESHPMPPPAEYPLRPRPRVSQHLRMFCDKMNERNTANAPHIVTDPPYSLIIVDEPNASNAFSYGFGPDGAGGIVVYSGFIDDVLAKHPSPLPTTEQAQSWSSWLFGPSSASSRPQHPIPTPEQTSELAILLSHELAHLVLSHHLETLSSATVIVPGSLSILSDVLRVIIFPITMLFGPFVNDAVAQLGQVSSTELTKIGEACTTYKQEIEADVVSARLLAYAGFDARDAVRFWENRVSSQSLEHPPSAAQPALTDNVAVRNIMGQGHPVGSVRVDRLKDELLRWETERRAALLKARLQPQESAVVLATA
ncbi:hypothetical protein EV714DRAFT_252775 [Schizophyllum commune]